jgi:hypothetical protein
MEVRDHVLSLVQNDTDMLEALEAMVGITPEMIAAAHEEWSKKPAKHDDVVEITPDSA